MPPGLPFLIIVFSLVVLCTILMVLLKAAAWWGEWHAGVSGYADNDLDDMSSSVDYASSSAPSSLQTDNRQTTDRPAVPMFTPAVKLDTYRLLRRHGVKRDDARPILQAIGMGLDNNLWTQAAPPATEPTYATPIAGRTTSAQFQDDPELEYQSPPVRA
mgnify:CR=1 FL=1